MLILTHLAAFAAGAVLTPGLIAAARRAQQSFRDKQER